MSAAYAEAQGWRAFDAVAAGWILEQRSVEELPSAAIAALEAGCDTPSLCVLAGADDASWSEIGELLKRVWHERGIKVPDGAEAERLFVDGELRGILEGDCSPQEGASRMWAMSFDMSHLHAEDVQAMQAPEHGFDYLDVTLKSSEEVEAETIEVARSILARGGVRLAATAIRHPSLDERQDPAVRMADADPGWPEQAAREIDRLRPTLASVEPAARVEHVGSTAVPGLSGKPVIDLLVLVADLDAPEPLIRQLTGLGYLFAPDPASPNRLFFGRPEERPRLFHVHVCALESVEAERHLAVRDYLRTHPDEVARYAELKRELIARAPGDRLEYIAGKRPFLNDLERRALNWRTSQESRGSWARLRLRSRAADED